MFGELRNGVVATRLARWGVAMKVGGAYVSLHAQQVGVESSAITGVGWAMAMTGLLLLAIGLPSAAAKWAQQRARRPLQPSAWNSRQHAFDDLLRSAPSADIERSVDPPLPAALRVGLTVLTGLTMFGVLAGALATVLMMDVTQAQLAGAAVTLAVTVLLALKVDYPAAGAVGLFAWGLCYTALATAIGVSLYTGASALTDAPHMAAFLCVAAGYGLLSGLLLALLVIIYEVSRHLVSTLLEPAD